MKTVQEAVAYIHSLYATGEKHGLDNMRALLSRLGDPQTGLAMAHVAGTNGKGSTCATLEAILRAAGLRTGLYTSPYLQRYNERIRIDGEPIGDEALTALVRDTAPAVEALAAQNIRVAEFEYGTALALCAFARAQVDVAVIEVGLGGRLDPTNVIRPLVCAVTAVGMDHMQLLGDTIEQIAAEKAGIVKPGVPVVIARMDERAQRVIERAAGAANAPALTLNGSEAVCLSAGARKQRVRFRIGDFLLDDAQLALPGAHQLDNAACALACALRLRERFDIPDGALREGLACVRWPGRLEWMGNVLLDAQPAGRRRAVRLSAKISGSRAHGAAHGHAGGQGRDGHVRAAGGSRPAGRDRRAARAARHGRAGAGGAPAAGGCGARHPLRRRAQGARAGAFAGRAGGRRRLRGLAVPDRRAAHAAGGTGTWNLNT